MVDKSQRPSGLVQLAARPRASRRRRRAQFRRRRRQEGLAQPPAKHAVLFGTVALRRLKALTSSASAACRSASRFCSSRRRRRRLLSAFKGGAARRAAASSVTGEDAGRARCVHRRLPGLKCGSGSLPRTLLRHVLFVGVHQAARRRLMLRDMGQPARDAVQRFHTTKKHGRDDGTVDGPRLRSPGRLLASSPSVWTPSAIVCHGQPSPCSRGCSQPLVAAIAFATLCALRRRTSHAVADAVLAGDGGGGAARRSALRRRGADERRDRQALRRRGVRSCQVRRAIRRNSGAIRRNLAQFGAILRNYLTAYPHHGRYDRARGFQRKQAVSERTLAALNLAQQGTVCLGLLCAMLAAARRVRTGAMSVGSP